MKNERTSGLRRKKLRDSTLREHLKYRNDSFFFACIFIISLTWAFIFMFCLTWLWAVLYLVEEFIYTVRLYLHLRIHVAQITRSHHRVQDLGTLKGETRYHCDKCSHYKTHAQCIRYRRISQQLIENVGG